jgi:hypothetical protein
MKIRFFVRSLKTGMVSDDHELKTGAYNEFYLPAIASHQEAWLIITDNDETETKLHLKR